MRPMSTPKTYLHEKFCRPTELSLLLPAVLISVVALSHSCESNRTATQALEVAREANRVRWPGLGDRRRPAPDGPQGIAVIIARMPVRIAGGSVGHAAMTRTSLGSIGLPVPAAPPKAPPPPE